MAVEKGCQAGYSAIRPNTHDTPRIETDVIGDLMSREKHEAVEEDMDTKKGRGYK